MQLTGDGGGKVPALARSLRGRTRVARTLVAWARVRSRMPGLSVRPVEVNGEAGALFLDAQQRVFSVWSLEIGGGEITAVRAIVNPDKLGHLGPVGDFGALVKGAR